MSQIFQVLIGYDRWLPDWLLLSIILSVLAPWLGILDYSGSPSRSRFQRISRWLLVIWLIDRIILNDSLWLPVAAVISGLWCAQEIRRIVPAKQPRRMQAVIVAVLAGLTLASLTSHVNPVRLLGMFSFALVLAGIYADAFVGTWTTRRTDHLRSALICLIVGGLVISCREGLTYNALLPMLAGGISGWLAVGFLCWRTSRARSGRSPWRLRTLLVVSWLFVAMWTALLPLELYFRYGYDTTDAIGHIRIAQRWMKRHPRYNSWRQRDVEYEPLEQWDDRLRVVVLGDSMAFGWGINDAKDMLGVQLERKLALRSTQRLKVFTLSYPGIGTVDEMKMFSSQGTRLKPHVVVLAYCMNDIAIGPPKSYGRSLPLLFPLMEASDFLEFFVWHLYSYFDWPPYQDRPSYTDAYADQEAFAKHTAEIDQLLSVIRTSGAEPIVAIFPFGKAPTADGPLRNALDRVSEVMRERNVPVVDVSRLVDVTDTRWHVNAFDAHPNPEMIRAIVPTIADYVMEALAHVLATQPSP